MTSNLSVGPAVVRPGEVVQARLGRGFGGYRNAQYSVAQVGDKLVITCTTDDAVVTFAPTTDTFSFQANFPVGVYEVQWVDRITAWDPPLVGVQGTADLAIAQANAIPVAQWEGYALVTGVVFLFALKHLRARSAKFAK